MLLNKETKPKMPLNKETKPKFKQDGSRIAIREIRTTSVQII